MNFFKDITRIADALEVIANTHKPVEPAPILPPEEAVSYYDDAKEALLQEIDRAKQAGELSPEHEAELLEAIEKEPL